MNLKRVLVASALVSTLCGGATASPNLIHNPDFARASPYGSTTSITATDPALLGGQAAAEGWTTWAGVPGGRVITSRAPTGERDGGYMLDVLVTNGGYGLVQAFLDPDHGPSQVHACVWIRLVSGAVGLGVGNGGDTHSTAFLDRPGSWELLGTDNAVAPANELIVYAAGSSGAEFQIRSAAVSEDSIPCHKWTSTKPETYVQPNTYPWLMHPEQGGAVLPAGKPAQGTGGNPNGFYDNMTPGGGKPAQGTAGNPNGFYDNMSPDGVVHDDSGAGGHEPTHPVPGKAPASSQQPAQPATQK